MNRKHKNLPPLSSVIDCWRSRDEFFFLRLFLDSQNCSVREGVDVRTPNSLVYKAVQKSAVAISLAFSLCILLIKCMLAPKNRILLFNHSERTRRNGNKLIPLYIPEEFQSKDVIVVEDALVDVSYKLDVLCLNGVCLTRLAEALGSIAVRFMKRPDIIDSKNIITFYIKRCFWTVFLQLLNPSCIRMFVWYGKEALLSAAKSLGMETADIQHGVIYKSHPFYKVKGRGIPLLSEVLLPDRVMVYGEYWKIILIESGWSPERVDVLGYFLNVKNGPPFYCSRPYILYSSQPTANGFIAGHVKSILPWLRSRGVNVVIALHPSEGPEGYSDVVSSVVTLVKGQSYPLLAGCVSHVSFASTLLWESIIFNKPSYLLNYGVQATDLLSDFLRFGFGRRLALGEFPEPFQLPEQMDRNFFFAEKIDRSFITRQCKDN